MKAVKRPVAPRKPVRPECPFEDKGTNRVKRSGDLDVYSSRLTLSELMARINATIDSALVGVVGVESVMYPKQDEVSISPGDIEEFYVEYVYYIHLSDAVANPIWDEYRRQLAKYDDNVKKYELKLKQYNKDMAEYRKYQKQVKEEQDRATYEKLKAAFEGK